MRVRKCEECSDMSEDLQLTRNYDGDKWRCFRCYGVAYPKSYAGRQIRGEVD